MSNIRVVPQVGCMSENLFTLVALLALVCITQCKSRNIGILQHFGGNSYHQRYHRVFSMLYIHVVSQVVCMNEDLLTLVAFVAWACGTPTMWEQQYWPIGGSADQGNYLKAYSHRPPFEKVINSPFAFLP